MDRSVGSRLVITWDWLADYVRAAVAKCVLAEWTQRGWRREREDRTNLTGWLRGIMTHSLLLFSHR